MLKKRFIVLLLVASVLPGLSRAEITNIDFTNGLTGWNPTGEVSVVTYDTGYNYVWYQENLTGDSISSISQSFDVPEGAQTLSFNAQMFSFDTPATDEFTVYLNDEIIYHVDNDSFPATSQIVSWGMSSYIGDEVLLKFEFISDPFNGKTTEVYIGQLNLLANTIPIVPVPPAVLLGGLGVASATWLRRRRVL